jgi:hypothetical protein
VNLTRVGLRIYPDFEECFDLPGGACLRNADARAVA